MTFSKAMASLRIGVSLSAIRSNIGMTASCSSELTAVALVSFMLPLLPESDPR